MYEGVYLHTQRFKRGHGFVTRDGDIIFVDADQKNRKLTKMICWYLEKAKEDEDLYRFAVDAGNALTEPNRVKVLEAINRICIKRGLVRYSVMATHYLGRVLTVEEREGLIESNLKRGNYERAAKAADLLSEPNRSFFLGSILSRCVSEGRWIVSKDIARSMGRNLSKAEKKTILTVAINSGAFWRAMSVSREMGQELTHKEAERVLRVLLREGYLEEAMEVFGYLGRRPTDGELGMLLEGVAEKGFIWYVVPIIDMFSEPQRTNVLEQVLSKFVDWGAFHDAQEVAELVDRRLSYMELERLLHSSLGNRDIERALLVIREMPEPERLKEASVIIDSSLEREDFDTAHQVAEAILKM